MVSGGSRVKPVIVVLTITVALILGASGSPAGAQETEGGISTLKTVTPNPVTVGEPLTYTVTVTNGSFSQRVGLRDFMPASLTFVSAVPSQGICGFNPVSAGKNAVDCTFGVIPAGSSATVTIVATPTTLGTVTNTAVGEAEFVPATPASFASAPVTVLAPSMLYNGGVDDCLSDESPVGCRWL